jgi:hypothetical protein
MILFYSVEITSRLSYIVKFLLSGILQVEVKFTANKEEFMSSTLPKINYSAEKMDGISIIPNHLLFEKGLRSLSCCSKKTNGIFELFLDDTDNKFSFDLFAASFFMVTRYEEYWPQPRDAHNRIKAEESTAYKNEFLDVPVVDQ